MTISERLIGGVAIVDIDGRITLQDGVHQFRAFVRHLLLGGRLHLVLNLGNVPYIDSTALGEIARAYATAMHMGGALKLLRVSDRVQRLLVITRLSAVFDVFDTEADAVKSFGAIST